jgi:2EXR family
MKIINFSRPDRKPLDRSEFLNLEILRLLDEIGVKERLRPTLPVTLKEEYLGVLENFIAAHGNLKKLQEVAEQEQCIKDGSFTCFDLLPTELRLKIWGFAFASHQQPRVHCVDVRILDDCDHKAIFMSNHPVHPILHTNHESRSLYLFKTQTTFAFETYINFSTDIIYIPDFAERCSTFCKFLDWEESRQIQKLAMRKDFFCEIPLPGHMSMTHCEMVDHLWDWKQMIVVFEDYRSVEEAWGDVGMVFREFSAREKRKRAERSYSRQQCKVLNEMMQSLGQESMDYWFGQFESGEDGLKRLSLS